MTMQVAIIERHKNDLDIRFINANASPLPVVHIPIDTAANTSVTAPKTIWDTDVRYQRYCEWCESLGIKPAEFEFWWRLSG